MKLIQSILLAYDFSETSNQALKEALILSKQFSAKLSIVHVNDHQIASIYGMPIGKNIEQTLHDKIRDQVLKIDNTAKIHSIDVFTGYPYFFIVAKAQTLPADLVIVGSHGRGGIKRILLGSVAEKVTRLSPVPVYVHRSVDRAQGKKILVPIDHSQYSEEAIPYAQLYAQTMDAQVQLVYVMELPAFATENHLAEIINKNMPIEEERLEELRKKYDLKLPSLVLQGPVSSTIADACDNDPDIGLVIMASHGKGGLKHLLMGSKAESLIRYSPCSVLTIRPEAIKGELHKRIEADIQKTQQLIQ